MIHTSRVLLFVAVNFVGTVMLADEPPNVLGKLPADFDVYAVGTYGSPKTLDIQLDDSGHDAVQVDVIVNCPTKPVVIVLTAYEPTVWRVGRTAQTELAGVLVSGYHTQALVGIERKTPHAISSYENKGEFPYFCAYGASRELLAMNETVKKLVGKEIDKFINKPNHGVFNIGAAPENDKEIVYSNELTIKEYVSGPRPLAGQRGLDQLVTDGQLRLATQADIDAWVDKASEKFKRFNPELRVEHYMRAGFTYVVLKECALPDGLYGAHSRAFIVPNGTPFPGGPKCHNTFYSMDGTARGAGNRDGE